MAKQDMVRINISILGISKLERTGMGKFISDDHYIYYCGQEFHRRNGVTLIINKRSWNATLGCNFKNDNDFGSFSRQDIYITVAQVYALTTLAEETEVDQFYEDLEDLLELTLRKDVLFIIEDWNAK